jgi:SAM-dependent methyltransferase
VDNAAAFVGNIPQFYDQAMGPIIFADYAADMAGRAAAIRPARVLETAAGTGIVTRQLRNALPAATKLTATDLNPPMLEIARNKFQSGEQVEFRQADATALPFADESFDAVVCQFGVMFYPDKDKSYREVRRVLVPGGRYLFSAWDAHRYNPFGRIVHEVAAGFFPVDPPQFMDVPFSYGFEPIKASLIDAGFGAIEASVVRFMKDIPDVAVFARGLVYGSPLIDQVAARGGVKADDIAAKLADEFRDAFGTAPARMPLQAVVFSATKPRG